VRTNHDEDGMMIRTNLTINRTSICASGSLLWHRWKHFDASECSPPTDSESTFFPDTTICQRYMERESVR
jgi:hypothetical protein